MENIKKDILSMTMSELEELILEIGEPKFRAKQIYLWLTKGAWGEQMRNIPKSLLQKLDNICEFRLPRVVKRLESKLD